MLLQRRASPSSLLFAAPDKMASTLMQVRQLVADAIASNVGNTSSNSTGSEAPPGDSRQGALLNQFEPILAAILAGIRGDHQEDQDEIVRQAGYVRACREDMVAKNSSLIAPRRASLRSSEEGLGTCESTLGHLNMSVVAQCSDAYEFIKNDLVASLACPTPTDASAVAIQQYIDCANASQHSRIVEAMELHAKCNNATLLYGKAGSECRDARRNILRTQCELNQFITTACDIYTACYSTETSRYTVAKAKVKAAETGRKREAIAYTKIRCLLELIGQNVSHNGGGSGEQQLAECDTLEQIANESEFGIEYPEVEGSSGCPLPHVEGSGTDFCTVVSLYNTSVGEAPTGAQCTTGEHVVIANPWGERLSDMQGVVRLSAEQTAASQWHLEYAGGSKVYLTSHRGERLEDKEGLLTVSSARGERQQWTVMAAGAGRFYLQSHRGEMLQDQHDHGGVGLTAERGIWQQWSIRGPASAPACTAMCTPTVEKDFEMAVCRDSANRGLAGVCFGPHNCVGWRGHVVGQSGMCHVTYDHAGEDGSWTGIGVNCVILATGVHPAPPVEPRTEAPHQGQQLLDAFERDVPGFVGSVKHCMNATDWVPDTVEFECKSGDMVIVAESYSYGFRVDSLKECPARV